MIIEISRIAFLRCDLFFCIHFFAFCPSISYLCKTQADSTPNFHSLLPIPMTVPLCGYRTRGVRSCCINYLHFHLQAQFFTGPLPGSEAALPSGMPFWRNYGQIHYWSLLLLCSWVRYLFIKVCSGYAETLWLRSVRIKHKQAKGWKHYRNYRSF